MGEEILLPPGDSGSYVLNHGLDPVDTDSQDPLMLKSKRGTIPRHRFEIEREALMIAPKDEGEPN